MDLTRIVSHLRGSDTAVISVEGQLGPELGVLAEAAGPQATELRLDRTAQLRPGELVLVKQPNDDAFFDAIGSQQWRRTYPFLRQALLKVQSADGNLLRLEAPAGLAWSAGQARVYRVAAVSDVHLSFVSDRDAIIRDKDIHIGNLEAELKRIKSSVAYQLAASARRSLRRMSNSPPH